MTLAVHTLAPGAPLGEDDAWNIVLDLRRSGALGFESPAIVVREDLPRGWTPAPRTGPFSARVSELFDLYVPLCVGPRSQTLVVAHLAQSLDGRVATGNGKSQFISGHDDLVHTHRLRALFDAVLVGASTVEHDDPRLTTRLVPGPDPVRVVLDAHGRLGPDHQVFRCTRAPTLLVRATGVRGPAMPSSTTIVEVPPVRPGFLPIADVLSALRERGLARIFVEGGGITVSNFLRTGALDRLHVTVAPVIIGSGRPAFTLPAIEDLAAALRLSCRHFTLGHDVLFDCPLSPPAS